MQPILFFYSRGWPALDGRSCANPHGNPRAPSDHIISHLKVLVQIGYPPGVVVVSMVGLLIGGLLSGAGSHAYGVLHTYHTYTKYGVRVQSSV